MKRAPTKKLELAVAQRLLRLDQSTGRLYWRVTPARDIKPGDEAGSVERRKERSTAYRRVSINNHKYLAHQVVFLLTRGYMPDQVDHKDRNGLNNHPDNLREATYALNARNRALCRTNTSGRTGVCLHKKSGLWFVHISVNGKLKSLGYYRDFQRACSVRLKAEEQYGYASL